MSQTDQDWGERFVRLTLAVDQHLPGYVDAYFGPEEWRTQSKQPGKVPIPELGAQANQLAREISHAGEPDSQRQEYLTRHLDAMQMSLRLLSGETVSLTEEVEALYDVRPQWKPEKDFEEAHRLLDELLPSGGSIRERMIAWDQSLEIPVEMVRELMPLVTERLRALTKQKFDLPEEESFTVEFVSDKPWTAYNWYLGNFQSRIDWNTDLPTHIHTIPGTIAHEGYPGHHTDLSIKEQKLVRERKYAEFTVNLLNAPSALLAEGIATTARETVLPDEELEVWLREEILPAAGMAHIDAARVLAISKASRKMNGLGGNSAFMLHDEKRSHKEISQYIQDYNLVTEKEADHFIRFISDPLSRSYIFTYHAGHDLLEELFKRGDRVQWFRRLIEEPVTPSLVRQWIQDSPAPASL